MLLPQIDEFLLCPTPQLWLDNATQHLDVLLVDHANCEKKAASSALTMMQRYPLRMQLVSKMSRLAREELRHFEQVISIIKKRGMEYKSVSSSRYAAGLHRHISKIEPQRLIDSLIVGAFIEARSCERFAKVAPLLGEPLQKFYTSLLKSESRHFQDYLRLAYQYADSAEYVDARIDFFAQQERQLIESEDIQIRFHSGVPISC